MKSLRLGANNSARGVHAASKDPCFSLWRYENDQRYLFLDPISFGYCLPAAAILFAHLLNSHSF